MNVTFGTMLKNRREQLGLSSALVATELGISQPYYHDVEHGNRQPFPLGPVYEKIAATLCLPRSRVLLAAHRGRLPEGCHEAVADLVALLLTFGGGLESVEIDALMEIAGRARTRAEDADAVTENQGTGPAVR